jgi:hypothetical protein
MALESCCNYTSTHRIRNTLSSGTANCSARSLLFGVNCSFVQDSQQSVKTLFDSCQNVLNPRKKTPYGNDIGSLTPLISLLLSMHSSQEVITTEARNGNVTSLLMFRLRNFLLRS